jgi:hypothetical protein
MVETIKGVPAETLQDILRRAIEDGEVRALSKADARTFLKLATWGQLSATGVGRYVITQRGRSNYIAPTTTETTDEAQPAPRS